ncbi:protein MAL2 [Gouania willdenowi]|uniref:MARVEL domain-containing protein n=1 Tax=Gouania willdenowi TaxID=441366 RepID=A0A8C5ETL8_GOUWI|nr:protein MAL2 [Gouania willdenowi]
MSEPAVSPTANDSPVAPPYPPSNNSLPLGLGVLRTYSGVLVCLEIILGGLVWILVASSNVPVPLFQGWVLFVSLTTFFLSTGYLTLLITGLASRINADLNCLDVTYHFFALLFYFGAFVLEAGVTAANGGASITPLPNTNSTVLCITYPPGNIITLMTNTQYSINLAATVFAFVVTLCYGCSVMMGIKRWMM